VTVLNSLNTNGLSFGGLATGIDTDTIITGLTKLNQTRIDALTSQQTDITTKQAAFTQLQGLMFDLQSKTNSLSRSAGGAFDGRTATSSDPTTLSAAAGTAAVPGTYSLTVSSLAQANQVASQGFADPNAQIKQGTLSLQVGTGTAVNVTVDSRNNTLQGLADSINAAGKDVRAAIINDGSGTPYRLTLTATKTGAANAIVVTNNLTTGTGADIDPTSATLQSASDASVKLGSGPGALTVTSATNQVNGLITGVTLNLNQANPNETTVLTVGNDTGAITTALQDFVTSYNATVNFVSSQSKYDTTTQTAGVLLGNSDTSNILSQLSGALTSTVPGLSNSANRISSVGLSLGGDGTLSLDTGKLNQALSGQDGATVADLKRLFALSGTSDNPGVAFVTGTDKTQPTQSTPDQVQITAPATRAVVTGGTPLGSSVTLTPPNNALQLKLNGLLSNGITLPQGTYSPNQLVSLLQQQINSDSSLQGNLVTVGLDSTNHLQITSQLYGAGSTVSFAGGTSLPDLGFTGSENATGTNVAGQFLVNGHIEAATGSGQSLIGNSGNANTDALQVRVTTNTPTTANLTVTQGLAGRLNGVLDSYLDVTNGKLKNATDGFQKQIDDITNNITTQNNLLTTKKNDLTQQFAAMETAVNSLKGIQTQLSSLVTTSS
jgi:flagellar hook-associated protein 2